MATLLLASANAPSHAANLVFTEADFLTLAGPVTVEDFEGAPLSGTTNDGALSTIAFNDFTASSVPDAVKVFDTPHVGNHNTTAGGSKYLALDTDIGDQGSTVVLTFDVPIYSIGFFLISTEHISLVDPRPVTIVVDGIEYPIPPTVDGGDGYVGILSASPFTTVDINPDAVDSLWSIDDVAFSTRDSGGELDVFFDKAPFLAATGSVTVEDFEGAPLSGTTNDGALPAIAFNDFTASSVPDAVKVFDTPHLDNHNTTAGGSKYLAIDTDVGSQGADVTLTFLEPITVAGLFLINTDHFLPLSFRRVAVRVAGFEYPIPPVGAEGEVFFGVVSGASFSSVEIFPDPVDSLWSLDDVVYAPEPSRSVTSSVAILSLVLLIAIRRPARCRRRQRVHLPVGSQNRSAAESLSFSLPSFDRPTVSGRTNPDEESVSY